MSGKVISLGARREKHLAMLNGGQFGGPYAREKYDAWIQADGSLVLRFHAEHVTHQKNGLTFGGGRTFEARGDVYEVRIEAGEIRQMEQDLIWLESTSRERVARLRGDFEWRCRPLEGGLYEVEHDQRKAVFEPFRPRARKAEHLTGETTETLLGPAPVIKRALSAPSCEACRRVVQIGEVAYRARKVKWETWFRGVVICAGCIAKAPGEGIREVGGNQ